MIKVTILLEGLKELLVGTVQQLGALSQQGTEAPVAKSEAPVEKTEAPVESNEPPPAEAEKPKRTRKTKKEKEAEAAAKVAEGPSMEDMLGTAPPAEDPLTLEDVLQIVHELWGKDPMACQEIFTAAGVRRTAELKPEQYASFAAKLRARLAELAA